MRLNGNFGVRRAGFHGHLYTRVKVLYMFCTVCVYCVCIHVGVCCRHSCGDFYLRRLCSASFVFLSQEDRVQVT